MLILTRRGGEKLYVGDDVTITVLAIHGTQVRLGITAPTNVAVHREEIYIRIKREQGLLSGRRRPFGGSADWTNGRADWSSEVEPK